MKNWSKKLSVFLITAVAFTTGFFMNMQASAANAASKKQSKVLIAYFGRYGNTNFKADVDATSSASVVTDGNKKRGTTEMLARLMKQGDKKKIKVSVTPKKGKKTVKFSSGNKKIAVVNKNGRVTAKKAGTAKIMVTVWAKGSAAKKTWVKIKVVKPSSDEKDDIEEPSAEVQPSSQETPEETPDTVPEPSPTETPSTVPNPSPGTIQPPVADNPTPALTETPDTSGSRKSIVMYFSCTNNTKTIAEYVAESTNADIYRVEPSVPYTSEDLNYGNSDSRATKEQNDSSARPAIAGELPSLDGYENVYLGYPIWWGQAPKIMYTFVETCNFTGKTIIPFCTSGSSGIGSSAENLHAANTNQAVWLTGKRFSGNDSKTEIENWVLELKLS